MSVENTIKSGMGTPAEADLLTVNAQFDAKEFSMQSQGKIALGKRDPCYPTCGKPKPSCKSCYGCLFTKNK